MRNIRIDVIATMLTLLICPLAFMICQGAIGETPAGIAPALGLLVLAAGVAWLVFRRWLSVINDPPETLIVKNTSGGTANEGDQGWLTEYDEYKTRLDPDGKKRTPVTVLIGGADGLNIYVEVKSSKEKGGPFNDDSLIQEALEGDLFDNPYHAMALVCFAGALFFCVLALGLVYRF